MKKNQRNQVYVNNNGDRPTLQINVSAIKERRKEQIKRAQDNINKWNREKKSKERDDKIKRAQDDIKGWKMELKF